MYRVTFQFESGVLPVSTQIPQGSTLLQAAQAAGIAQDAPCGGNGLCGKCRVRLLRGETEQSQSRHLSARDYADGWRLSCESRPISDVTVQIPAGRGGADIHCTQKRTRLPSVPPENGFLRLRLPLSAPTQSDCAPDAERLERAIRAKTGCREVRLTVFALQKLPRVLREAGFDVYAAGCREADGTFTVYDVTKDDLPVWVCAVDLGTTTVEAVLADAETGAVAACASIANAQSAFGADVISRITAQTKPDGRKRLQDAILDKTLLPLLDALCRQAKTDASRIVRVCIAGNTTMNHLLLGPDADPIRKEPYIPGFFRLDGLRAKDLPFPAHPDARVLLAPNVGSYVGGDITAGAFASGIRDADGLSALIDLGTNGELVLGGKEFLLTCACSAGPAFEGGGISCGMRAADGAVDAVSLDADTAEPTLSVLGGGRPLGLCGSGIIDTVAELLRIGALSAKGVLLREGGRFRRDRCGVGRYILAHAGESGTGEEIALTETDIAALIRAKAAVFSALRTMLAVLDTDVHALTRVLLAGGIGNGVHTGSAIRIGLLPKLERSRFVGIGNASLGGAYAMALSERAAQQVLALAADMTYLELSTHPGYPDEFTAACFLPHTDGSLFS